MFSPLESFQHRLSVVLAKGREIAQHAEGVHQARRNLGVFIPQYREGKRTPSSVLDQEGQQVDVSEPGSILVVHATQHSSTGEETYFCVVHRNGTTDVVGVSEGFMNAQKAINRGPLDQVHSIPLNALSVGETFDDPEVLTYQYQTTKIEVFTPRESQEHVVFRGGA